MNRIAVTGPTGAIGIALIQECIKNKIEVYAICRPGSARTARIPRNDLVHIIECSLDKLEQLREEFGFYAQRLLTFQYEGESGAAKMADIMRKLRAPLDTFQDAHFPTATRIDYQNDETGLPKSDVLSFALADGSKIIVRPSGTEPKLKAYLFARGENQAAAEKVLDELETLMNGYCKE